MLGIWFRRFHPATAQWCLQIALQLTVVPASLAEPIIFRWGRLFASQISGRRRVPLAHRTPTIVFLIQSLLPRQQASAAVTRNSASSFTRLNHPTQSLLETGGDVQPSSSTGRCAISSEHNDLAECWLHGILHSPESQCPSLPVLTPDEVERTLDSTLLAERSLPKAQAVQEAGQGASNTWQMGMILGESASRAMANDILPTQLMAVHPPSGPTHVASAAPMVRPPCKAYPSMGNTLTSSVSVNGTASTVSVQQLQHYQTTIPMAIPQNGLHRPQRPRQQQQPKHRTTKPRRPARGTVINPASCTSFNSQAARMEKLHQQKANARRREHDRVRKTSQAFEQLKLCLIRSDPIAKTYMRCFNIVSKINILKAATAHIAELTSQLQEEEDTRNGNANRSVHGDDVVQEADHHHHQQQHQQEQAGDQASTELLQASDCHALAQTEISHPSTTSIVYTTGVLAAESGSIATATGEQDAPNNHHDPSTATNSTMVLHCSAQPFELEAQHTQEE